MNNRYDAAVARAYREHLIDELAGKPLDRAFLDAFAERCAGERVLDVGCGPGHVAHYLLSRNANVAGLDLSPAMIDEARRAFHEIDFFEGDMTAMPFADGSLGGLVAFYAIVHLPTADLGPAFREFARVLAPGGLAAIAFHIGTEQVHVDDLFGVPTSLDFYFHDPLAVIAALDAAGFALEARLDREPYPNAEHASRRCYLLSSRRAPQTTTPG